MNRRFTVSLIVLAVLSAQAFAQNVIDLIISEAVPDSVVVDDYGRMSGYIEVYNTSQGTVNIGGCYLTDDSSDLSKSLIPKGYAKGKIGPGQNLLFFTSGNGSDGLTYTDFTISRGRTIYLVSNDGKTIIDSLSIPAGLPAGMAAVKLPVDAKGIRHAQSDEAAVPSPYMKNGDQNAESGSQRMARTDPHGLILTIVSVTVVFCALAILWFLFWILFERPAKKKSTAASKTVKKAAKAKGGKAEGEVAAAIAMALDMESNGDTYAAIATALHLYLNDSVHDQESFISTIKPSQSSNWTDRTQTFRRMPR